jgi:hypothetical protein
MQRGKPESNNAKQQYIKDTLKYLGLDAHLKQISEKLNEDKNIVVTEYLDEALTPVLSDLCKTEKPVNYDPNFPTPEEKFIRLLSLCFKGDVSTDVLNKVWNQFSEKEKLFYGIGRGFGLYPGPLILAFEYENLPALELLKNTYGELVPRHNQLYRREDKYDNEFWDQLHSQIINAYPKIGSLEYFNHFLDMCVRYSYVIEIGKNNNSFSNRRFEHYHTYVNNDDGEIKTVVYSSKVTLLNMFVYLSTGILKHYIHDKYRRDVIKALLAYVKKNGAPEDFEEFKKILAKRINAYSSFESFKEEYIKNASEFIPDIAEICKKLSSVVEDTNKEMNLNLSSKTTTAIDTTATTTTSPSPIIQNKPQPQPVIRHNAENKSEINPDISVKSNKEQAKPQMIYPASYEASYKKGTTALAGVVELFRDYCGSSWDSTYIFSFKHSHAVTIDKFIKEFIASPAYKEYENAKHPDVIKKAVADFLEKLNHALQQAGQPLEPAPKGSLASRILFIQDKFQLNCINLDELYKTLSTKKPRK